MRNAYKILVEKASHFGYLGVDGIIILKMILNMLGRRLNLSCSGEGPVAGCCEHSNETSNSIKSGEFHD
jgi:hypothetical protein